MHRISFIEYEKFIMAGQKYVKILGWNNIKRKDELPKAYFTEYPYFYTSDDSLILIVFDAIGDIHTFRKDAILPLQNKALLDKTDMDFTTLKMFMEESAERLHDITSWLGRDIVEINYKKEEENEDYKYE